MQSEYLMNIASALYLVCYVPELYANYKNRNANIYNLPEKIVIFIGSSFAFSYSLINMNNSLLLNYGPILALDGIALIMRGYYVYKGRTQIYTLGLNDAASQTVTTSSSITEDADCEMGNLTTDASINSI